MAKKEKTLKEHSLTELEAKYHETCKELFEYKNEYRMNGQIKKPHLFKKTKKEIARILTEVNIKSKQETKEEKSSC